MSFLDSLMYAGTLRGNPGFAAMERQRMEDERNRGYLMEDLARNQGIYDQYFGEGGLMTPDMNPMERARMTQQLGHQAGLTSPLKDVRGVYGASAFDLAENEVGGGGDPTSQMKNWNFRNQLVQQFGENSIEVRRFDNWVARENWQRTGQHLTLLSPGPGGQGYAASPPAGVQEPIPEPMGSPYLAPGEMLSPDSQYTPQEFAQMGATPMGPTPTPAGPRRIPIDVSTDQLPENVAARESAKGIAGEQVKEMAAIGEAASAARRNLVRLNQLRQYLKEGGSGMGPALQLFASDWGLNIGEGVNELQAARALINAMVPAQRPPGSGPMSDADIELFKQSLPRVINQPGGNELILDTLTGIAQYDANLGKIQAQYMSGRITYNQARQQIENLENPLENYGETVAPAAAAPEEYRSAAQAELQRRRNRPGDRRRNRGVRQ